MEHSSSSKRLMPATNRAIFSLLALAGLAWLGLIGCENRPGQPGPGQGTPKASSPAAVVKAPPPVWPEFLAAPATSLATRPAEFPKALTTLAVQSYASGEVKGPATRYVGRNTVRRLFSFEDGQDAQPVQYPALAATNMNMVFAQANGVTEGKWCARMTVPAGEKPGSLAILPPAVEKWADFDYLAFDLFTEDQAAYTFTLDLADKLSTDDFHTHSTEFETAVSHPGRQTMLFRISRAKRTSKEGRDWSELLPKDKIDLKALTSVAIHVTPRTDRPAVFWIDNIRLLQEDAARPRLYISLPQCAVRAFDFCTPGAVTNPFMSVPAETPFTAERGYGFLSTAGLIDGGKGWPDALSGTFVQGGFNQEFAFKAAVPNGRYRLWLCAGPVMSAEGKDPQFLLKVNDRLLHRDAPAFADYDSTRYLYRFMWTQYSERPHGLWMDYIDKLFPAFQETVDVTDGAVTVTAKNYFLSALVLVPAESSGGTACSQAVRSINVAQPPSAVSSMPTSAQPGAAVPHETTAQAANLPNDFDIMNARLQTARMAAFERTLYTPKRPPPQPVGNEDCLLYAPDSWQTFSPWRIPTEQDRKRTSLSLAGAPGQKVLARVVVAAFRELGPCQLHLADLAGPDGASIPAGSIQGFFANYHRGSNGEPVESVLLPTLSFHGERGLSHCLWLWLTIPADARPGKYIGNFTLTAGSSSRQMPVELEVYPIKLETVLPLACGFYYGGRDFPTPPEPEYWPTIRRQWQWMKQAGFTATDMMDRWQVLGVDEKAGKVRMSFDATGPRILKELGFGQHPAQMQMTRQLPIAREVARRLMPSSGPSGSPVDSTPGSELANPAFRACWQDALGQYRKFLDSLSLAYATEVVDEPRETPNPWNRNLRDTCLYGDWMAAVGWKTRFITPMSDRESGLDYTPLVKHTDIISMQADAGGSQMYQRVKEGEKTLWFYNCGISRLLWGAYLWKHQAAGMWQWHWSTGGSDRSNGYPGDEWYNPFGGPDALAPNAPAATFAGGFLPKSSLLVASDGLTDYAYLHTLELAIKSPAAADKPAVIKLSQEFLQQVRLKIAAWPQDQPAERLARESLDGWRQQAARLLMELQK